MAQPVETPSRAAGSFEAFYVSRYAWAVRLASLLVGSVDRAEEIAQDAFVGMHLHWAQLEHPAAYLHRSVVNGCRDELRRRSRWGERAHLVTDEDVHHDAPLELVDALDALPIRHRAALVLRYWGGLDEREIADALGVRPGTVKSLIHRGLARLRKEVEP